MLLRAVEEMEWAQAASSEGTFRLAPSCESRVGSWRRRDTLGREAAVSAIPLSSLLKVALSDCVGRW